MLIACETGWRDDYIFWELPLARLIQYHHFILRKNDAWTVKETVKKPYIETFQKLVKSINDDDTDFC